MRRENILNNMEVALEQVREDYRHPFKGRTYERILCYEFYHQFRCIMEKDDTKPTTLHGELIKKYIGIRSAPDFVFHIPRSTTNEAVIEFKRASESTDRIKHDLDKIKQFMGGVLRYKLGVLVLFGSDGDLRNAKNRIKKHIQDRYITLILYDTDNGKVLS